MAKNIDDLKAEVELRLSEVDKTRSDLAKKHKQIDIIVTKQEAFKKDIEAIRLEAQLELSTAKDKNIELDKEIKELARQGTSLRAKEDQLVSREKNIVRKEKAIIVREEELGEKLDEIGMKLLRIQAKEKSMLNKIEKLSLENKINA